MKTRVHTVTRSFQGGTTFATFDLVRFEKGIVDPIKKLLATAPVQFSGISVISCAENGSKYSEEVRDGETPTTYHLRQFFAEEIANKKLNPVLCYNWGLNAGSGTAVNLGIEQARQYDATKVLVWSPEIDLTGHMLSEMLYHMESHALSLVGYMRNRWYQRLQWAFAQNTCAVWDIKLLDMTGGMNPECNGDGKKTVSTLEFGEVPLAGMEDIEAYFRASSALGEFVRWGGVGMRHPALWNIALKVPGTREHDDNLKKIARQAIVMDTYAKRIFPQLEPIDVYDNMMKVASLA